LKASSEQRRGAAQVALKEAPTLQAVSVPVPAVKVDLVGAISVVPEGERVEEGVYKNIDGHRFEDGRYAAFTAEISQFIGKERQFTDPVRTFAYGTDASFYRLNPKMVVKIHNEEEVKRILPIAKKHGVPVTFRAAGTSLSGQALTDSVLLKLSHTGKNFRNFQVHVSSWAGAGSESLLSDSYSHSCSCKR
jgi:D-lactate dehydrogenase